MLRTVDELKAQAQKLNIQKYRVHDCSMCGYPCGYEINGDEVTYDAGCNCVDYRDISPRSWEELAQTYNRNQPENNPKISPEFLVELNAIWQFPEEAHNE